MSADSSASPIPQINEDGDWIARQFFSAEDLRLSPEEYIARHAHALGNFSFHLYRYRDPGLGTWVRRVGELLATAEDVARCRQQFLSADELAAVRRQEGDDL